MPKPYTKEMVKRDERIAKWRERGWTQDRIALREGLSIARIKQILEASKPKRGRPRRAA